MATNYKDRLGETINGFTVIAEAGWKPIGKRRVQVWTFRCSKGHEFNSPFHSIASGALTCRACRTKPPNIKNLEGKTFAGLLVRSYAGSDDGHAYWHVQCQTCGSTDRCQSRTLQDRTRCFCTANTATHGESKTPTYAGWRAMLSRCYNVNDINYHNYGGRGITVCDRWHTYEHFKFDMGLKPDKWHLDRIDNSKGYGPDNCRWVTHSQNARNMRKSIFITWNGETRQLTDWSDHFGWPHNVLSLRHFRKWSVERMMTTPPRNWPPRKKR